MIDINSEVVVSLTDAARLLPRRRAGKKPNVCTLYRVRSIAGLRSAAKASYQGSSPEFVGELRAV